MKKVTGYRCEYCGRIFLTEHGCINHEKSRCSKNPNHIPFCYKCEYYEESFKFTDNRDNIKFVIGTSWDGVDITNHKEFEPNRCGLRKCKLYNNIKLSEELQDALNDNGYEPMPTLETGGCENFKERGSSSRTMQTTENTDEIQQNSHGTGQNSDGTKIQFFSLW